MKSGRILVFGDSIGQGYYDAKNGGWVRLLQQDFFNDYFDGRSEFNIINLSVSGHSSVEVRKRIETEVAARDNGEPLTTIIAIGINDSYEKAGIQHTHDDDFMQNITDTIRIALKSGSVLVLGLTYCVESRLTPTSWNDKLYYTNKLVRRYDALLKRAADAEGVPYLLLWDQTRDAQMREETMPDGIHPNDKGHKVIYNEVKKKLKDIL